ncbi:hypothetical protein DFJ73DRAFT_802213 [Zopfochytrium polystomum]|nr:hypothetical protein DFJ73DRAFT_802213 [Zopfochytrium polystomum]
MGVLSRARVSLAFDADAWVDPAAAPSSSSSTTTTATPSPPTTAPSASASSSSSSSSSPHLQPVFEFPESRQRPPAWGDSSAARRAYDSWRAAATATTSAVAGGVGRIRGRVVVDVEAGAVGRATVRASNVVLRLVRREPMQNGPPEVLCEETLWAAAGRGEEELAAGSPSFAEVPSATTGAALGTGRARGASYGVVAIVNRPVVREIETSAVVVLRHAAPRAAIERTPLVVHRGTIAGGTVAYTITAPRVVASSLTTTFPVTSAPPPAAWTATGKTTEWFGASPAWARHAATAAAARPEMAVFVADVGGAKGGAVRDGEGAGTGEPGDGEGSGEEYVGGEPAEEEEEGEEDALFEDAATLAGGDSADGGDSDGDAAWAASVLGDGGSGAALSSGVATLQLGTAGLRGDWCDGDFYLAHCVEISLAPAIPSGRRRRWLLARGKGGQGETVRVPVRVVYAAEGDHHVGWVLPDEWDEWPWRRVKAVEGFKPLWMG